MTEENEKPSGNGPRPMPVEPVSAGIRLDLTVQEAQMLRQALDQVPVQGTQTMVHVLALAAKLEGALAQGQKKG